MAVAITRGRIDGWRFELPPASEVGAELLFTGLVRDREAGRKIRALVYEHYEGMAQKEIEKLGFGAVERFGIVDLHCVHRVGTVPVGEAAIVVLVRSKHREEGLRAMGWFVEELKRVVPIWKTGSVED